MFYSCLFVCLSVSPLDYLKSYQQILMKDCGWVGHGQKNSGLDFCVSPESLFTIALSTGSQE